MDPDTNSQSKQRLLDSTTRRSCFPRISPVRSASLDGTTGRVRSLTNFGLYYRLAYFKNCFIHLGNRWNPTKNETGELGAGDQEIFRGCSDVSIGSYPPDRTTVKPFHITKPSTTRPTTLKPSTTSSQRPSTTKPPMSTPRPHQFPTQRPPVTLPPTAKPVPTSSLPQSTTTRPKHPVMRPPGKVPPLAIMNQDSNAL